jgi:hypothetical protein
MSAHSGLLRRWWLSHGEAQSGDAEGSGKDQAGQPVREPLAVYRERASQFVDAILDQRPAVDQQG